MSERISDRMFDITRNAYQSFLGSCEVASSEFKLTPMAEVTPYALCFGLFGLKLLNNDEALASMREAAVQELCNNVKNARSQFDTPPINKPYRQLLTFTLSALSLLDAFDDNPLEDLITEQISDDVAIDLEHNGVLKGQAGSGNQAMFLAIFLLHARDYMGVDTQSKLDTWVELHIKHMNRFGFWGPDKGMTHLQFQNGYHQHEILEYLGIDNPLQAQQCDAVSSLADSRGHFAPYPGGGGCYDYDAVFMLTPHEKSPNETVKKLLSTTNETIISEQKTDGGFCESLKIRPRSISNYIGFAGRVLSALNNQSLFVERLRYAVTLQRPKHDRIHTHWSEYSRGWGESDLWDSWFRMLTLARIDVAMDPSRTADWGFIDYPGIGFHPSLAAKRNKH